MDIVRNHVEWSPIHTVATQTNKTTAGPAQNNPKQKAHNKQKKPRCQAHLSHKAKGNMVYIINDERATRHIALK